MKTLGWFLVLGGILVNFTHAGQVNISLHPNDWSDYGIVTASRSLTQTTEGYLRATCNQYRGYISYRSNEEHNLQGAIVRYKWRLNCGGNYCWTKDGVYPYSRMAPQNLTTHHSWAGSLLISTNTWIYTELRFNLDRTWSADYSYSGYGKGGLTQNSGTITDTAWDSLASSFLHKYAGDGYNSSSYFDIAEAFIVTSGPSVEITSPPSDPFYAEFNVPILFQGNVTKGIPPYTFHWESNIDGPLGDETSIEISTLSLGDHVVTATCVDDANDTATSSIMVYVTVAPQIGTINDETIPEGQPYIGPVPTLNEGARWIECSLVDGPEGMTINPETGVVSWPNPFSATEPYRVTVQAENPLGSDQVSWQVTVMAVPEIDQIPLQLATEYSAFVSAAPSLVKGSEPVEWHLVSGPTGMTIDSETGVVSWDNPLPSFDPYSVTIRASNSIGYDDETFSIVVHSVPLVSAIADVTIIGGQPYGFDPTLTKGNPAVTWELLEAPADMNINSSSGSITWLNPGPEDSTHAVTVKAANPLGSHSRSYQIRVMLPPVLDDLSNDSVHEGIPYQKSVSTSQGTLPLTFTLLSAPSGMSIDPSTGTISWAYPNGHYSPYTVSVRVGNEVGAANKSFILTVLQQPVIKMINESMVAEGDVYTGPIPQLYQGSPTVTWSLVNGPSGMTINTSTGQVSWPNAVYNGSPYSVMIQAENVVGSDTEGWDVEVVQPPVIAPYGNEMIGNGVSFISSLPALTQGAHINWSLEQAPAEITINSATGQMIWASPIASSTPYTVRLRAENIAGADTEEFQLTVLAKPVLGPIADVTVDEIKPYTSDPAPLLAGQTPITFSLSQAPSGMIVDPNSGVMNWANPTAVGSPHSVKLRATNAYGYDEKMLQITVPIGYAAEAWTDLEMAPSGTPIPIRGRAYYLSDGLEAGNLTVHLEVRVRNTTRIYKPVTNELGEFEFVFEPVAGEAGLYLISAGHPLMVPHIPQDTFTLVDLRVADAKTRLQLIEGTWYETTVNLTNPGNTPLTNIQAAKISGPNSIDLDFVPVATLEGDTRQPAALRMVANDASVLQSTVSVLFTSDEGAVDTVTYSVQVTPLTPELAVYPKSLEAGMVRGQIRNVSFEVYNKGGTLTPELTVLIPDAQWLVMNTPEVIGAHEPNDVTVVALTLQPDADLPLGPYEGLIIVYGTGMSQTIPFKFNCVSDQFGGLDIEAVDEFTYYAEGAPLVEDAKLTLREAFSGNIFYQSEPMVDGRLLLEDLPEAYYSLDIQAFDHGSYHANVYVAPGVNSKVVAFLPRQLVKYTWTVEPTEIEDVYTVTLDTTFETDVPAPVVVIDPANVDLSKMVDGQMQVDFTIANHGLVAAEDFHLMFDNHPRYQVELLTDFNGRLGPNETVVVPAIIRDLRQQAPFASPDMKYAAAESSGPISPFLGDCDPVTGGGYYTLVCGKDRKWHKVPVTAANWLCDAYNLISGIVGSGSHDDYDPSHDYGDDETPEGQWPDEGSGQTPATGRTASGGGVITTGPVPGKPRPPQDNGSSPRKPYIATPTIITGGGDGGGCDPCPRLMMTAILECAYSFLPLNCPLTILKSAHDCYRNCTGFGTDSYSCLLGCTGSAVSIIASCGKDLSPIGVGYNIVMCIDSIWNACETGNAAAYMTAANKFQMLTGADLPDVMLTSEQESLAFLIEQRDRLMAVMDALSHLLGDPIWFSGEIGEEQILGDWLQAYADAISESGDGAEVITEAEQQTLGLMPLPIQVTLEHVGAVCQRWNRTIDYWQTGKFDTSDLNPEDDADFIAVDVASQKFEQANEAILANEAQGYMDLFDGVVDGFDQLKVTLDQETKGICAKVHLQIEQSAVMTRTGFRATLDMQNQSATDSLDNIMVELIVTDKEGTETTTLFGIYPPLINGITDVSGGGDLQPGQQFHAEWLLVPTLDAAPDAATNYFVGGNIHYTVNGHAVTIPIFPDTITVKPDANLNLKYFFERDVYGDDPFTEDVVEPSVPFVLGLMVTNTGAGSAYNMTIQSAQPTIVRHEKDKDILIDFELLDTQVGNEPRVPSLQVSMGHILPNSTKVARWHMQSSLQGEFTNYSASFAHTDTLGDPRLSLIQSTTTHELVHAVLTDRPQDDDIVDFLTNDVPDVNGLPDTVHLSEGTEVEVSTYLGDETWLSGSADSGQITLSLAPDGFFYVRLPNPGWPDYELHQVVRSDGKVLPTENAWTTYRMNYPEEGDPYAEIGLHLFDHDGTGIYTLYFKPAADLPPTVIDFEVADVMAITNMPLNVTVTYVDNEELDLDSLNGQDIQVMGPGGHLLLVEFVQVESQQGAKIEAQYQIIPPEGLWEGSDNGLYSVSLIEGQVGDTAGNFAPATTLGGFLVAIDRCVNVEVISRDLIEQRRVSRTVFEMTYTVKVQSYCNKAIRNLRVIPQETPSNLQLVSHDIRFCFIAPNGQATSPGTFTVRVDYQDTPDLQGQFVWQMIPYELADVNMDGGVDLADLAEFAGAWLQNDPCYDWAPEPNGDGLVNLVDFNLLGEQWLYGNP